MVRRIDGSIVLAAAAVMALIWSAPAAAQIGLNGRPPGAPANESPTLEAPPASGPWKGPLTPDGQPDVQGMWRSNTGGLSHSLEEGEDPGDNPSGRAAAKPPNVIYEPADGRMPYQPWALSKKRQNLVNLETPTDVNQVDPDDKCWLPGTPRAVYQRSNNFFQITQVPGFVLMFYPTAHVFRIIPLDARPRAGEGMKLLNGDPRGRWEGNTLIIDTTNQDENWFDSHGSFYSSSIHVVERWTFEGKTRLSVDMTVEDPKVFTRPMKIRIAAAPVTVTEDRFWEETCHEGERNVARIVSIGTKMKEQGKTGIHTHNLPASIK